MNFYSLQNSRLPRGETYKYLALISACKFVRDLSHTSTEKPYTNQPPKLLSNDPLGCTPLNTQLYLFRFFQIWEPLALV